MKINAPVTVLTSLKQSVLTCFRVLTHEFVSSSQKNKSEKSYEYVSNVFNRNIDSSALPLKIRFQNITLPLASGGHNLTNNTDLV